MATRLSYLDEILAPLAEEERTRGLLGQATPAYRPPLADIGSMLARLPDPPKPQPKTPKFMEVEITEDAEPLVPLKDFQSALIDLLGQANVTTQRILDLAKSSGYVIDQADADRLVLEASSTAQAGAFARENTERQKRDAQTPVKPEDITMSRDPELIALASLHDKWINAPENWDKSAAEMAEYWNDLNRERFGGRIGNAGPKLLASLKRIEDYRAGKGEFAGAGRGRRAPPTVWPDKATPEDLARAVDAEGNVNLEQFERNNRPTLLQSIGKGSAQLRELGFRALEAYGEVLEKVGDPTAQTVKEYAGDQAEFYEAIGQASPKGVKLGDIESFSDAAQWAKQVLGEQGVMMAPGLGGAAAGARIAGSVGAKAGAFVPSAVLGIGEAQSEAKRLDPNSEAGAWTFVGGTAIGALDSMLPGRIGSRMVREMGEEAAEREAARLLLLPANAQVLAVLRRAGTEGLKSSGLEGLTEFTQEIFAAAAGSLETGQPIDPNLPSRAVEAGVTGAFMGGSIGASTSATSDVATITADPFAVDTNREASALAVRAMTPAVADRRSPIDADVIEEGRELTGLDPAPRAPRPARPAEPAEAQDFVVPEGKITSRMGPRKPFRTKSGKMASSNHAGVDIRMAEGTPIPVGADGEVVFAGRRGGYGNQVVVRHADGSTSSYSHQSKIEVRVGDVVRQGDIIGRAGQTGNAKGSHLHLERRDANGNRIDPLVGSRIAGTVAEPEVDEVADEPLGIPEFIEPEPVEYTEDEEPVYEDDEVVGYINRTTGAVRPAEPALEAPAEPAERREEALATQQPLRLNIAPDPENNRFDQRFSLTFQAPNGDTVEASLRVDRQGEGVIDIHGSSANRLGPVVIRSLAKELADNVPELRSLSGTRVTGSRRRNRDISGGHAVPDDAAIDIARLRSPTTEQPPAVSVEGDRVVVRNLTQPIRDMIANETELTGIKRADGRIEYPVRIYDRVSEIISGASLPLASEQSGRSLPPPQADPAALEARIEKIEEKLFDFEVDGSKSALKPYLKKLVKEGVLEQAEADGLAYMFKDRDMDVEDITSEIRTSVELWAERERGNVGRGLNIETGGIEAPAPAGGERGGLRGKARLLDEPAGSDAFTAPLAGSPAAAVEVGDRKVEITPYEPARRAAAEYAESAGIQYEPAKTYVKVDPVRAKSIADEYDRMEHAPNNPVVRSSYEAMAKETLAQWEAIKRTGLKVDFIDLLTGDDPYSTTPRLAQADVLENNHLWVFNTEDGYGAGGVTPQEEAENPMLAIVPGETISGRPVRVNDIFRIVHDYFGHIKDGHGFRATGEENAWQSHAAMYSPLARRAMTTETRGQNSWVNFGPYGETNRTASSAETTYAPQKIGLLPEWVSEAAMEADPAIPLTDDATWTTKRIDDLIAAYSYSDGRTKAWAGLVSPEDFLGLTASAGGREIISRESRDLDAQELADQRQPIFLVIEPGGEPSNVQKKMGVERLPSLTMGHEGRHRMVALAKAGVKKVPVVILNQQGGRQLEPIDKIELTPQRSRGSPLETGDKKATLTNLIPITPENRERLRELGGAKVKFRVQGELTQTNEFKKWFGDSKVVNKDGSPMVVYHGTGKDFEAFDISAPGTYHYDGLNDPGGFFFAPSKQDADKYGEDMWLAGRTLAVYLSIQNPAYIEVPMGDRLGEQTKLLREARAAGHDGAYIINRGEWVAFEPYQIKSVENSGAFNPDDPRIKESVSVTFGLPVREAAFTSPGMEMEAENRVDEAIRALEEELTRTGVERIAVGKVVRYLVQQREGQESWNWATNTGGLFVPKEYGDNRHLIVLAAMADPEANFRGTARHEIIHALREQDYFTQSEWTAMSKFARSDPEIVKWAEAGYPGLDEEALTEEMVAEKFGRLRLAIDTGEATVPKGFVGKAFEKFMNLINYILDAMRRVDVTHADIRKAMKVYEDVATGKFMEERGPAEPTFGEEMEAEYGWQEAEGVAARALGPGKESRTTAAQSAQGGLGDPTIPDPGVARRAFTSIMKVLDSIASGVKPGDSTWSASESQLSQLREAITQKHATIDRVGQRAAEKRGLAKLPEREDVMQKLAADERGYKITFLQEQMIEPLVQAMIRNGLTKEEVGLYLYARHAPARNARIAAINKEFRKPDNPGSGMTNAEAQQIIQDYANNGKLAGLDEVAAIHDQIIAWAQQERLEGGLITQTDINAGFGPGDFYTPLRGNQELEPEHEVTLPYSGEGTGSGASVRGMESKRAMGRRSMADPSQILGYAIVQAQQAADRAYRAKVGQTIYNQATANPDPGFWRVDKVDRRAVWDRATGTVRYEMQQRLTKEEEARTIFVKVGGDTHKITFVAENPTAMRYVRAAKNLDIESLKGLTYAVGMYSRYFSKINTQLNLEFVVTNMVRDIQTGLANSSRIDVPGLQKKLLANIASGKALAHSMRGGFRRAGEGAGSQNEWVDVYERFRANGGKIAFNQINPLEDVLKSLDTTLRQAQQNRVDPRRMVRATFDLISRLNDGAENLTRLAAFKALVDSGVSDKEAARVVRELTVNFSQHGRWGPRVNAWFAFANASTIGNAQVALAIAKSKKGKAIALGLIALGLAHDTLMSMFYPEWDEYDEKEKKRNFIIPTQSLFGQDINIPMGYGWHVFVTMGRKMSELGRGKKDEAGNVITPWAAAADMAIAMAEGFSPITGNNLWSIITPTIFDPAGELVRNENFFGKPIYKESPFSKAPNSQQAWEWTADYWKVMATSMNKLTGGNETLPGAVDLNPEWIQHIVEQNVLGGAGRTLGRIGGLVAEPFDEEPINPEAIPFARSFISTPDYGPSPEAQQISRYNQRLRASATILGYAKEMAERGSPDYKGYYRENERIIKLAPVIKEAEKRSRAINRAENAATKGANRVRGLETKEVRAISRVTGILLPTGRKLTDEEEERVKEAARAREAALAEWFNRRYEAAVQ